MVAQLGVANRVYPQQCQQILRRMLELEKDENVLDSIICALGHQSPQELASWLSPFVAHPDPELRRRVTWALWQSNSDLAIEHLLKLSRDEDSEVRDWATSGLGNSERDTPEIRQALLDRVNDSDCDTRGEALCGLVRLKHPKVLAMVEHELDTSEQISNFTLDAAELLAAQQLVPHLQELQSIEGNDYDKFQRVIDACSHSQT
jgi:HEAT repeat protein